MKSQPWIKKLTKVKGFFWPKYIRNLQKLIMAWHSHDFYFCFKEAKEYHLSMTPVCGGSILTDDKIVQ
jgi:hypothetical protein